MNNLNSYIKSVKFCKYLIILSYFCIFLLNTNELLATNYYVSITGSNNNNGLTEGTAWETITYAATQAVAGDTVYIKAGNYGAENVIVTNSGTAGNPITFEGYKNSPGDNPTVDYTFGDTLYESNMPLLTGVRDNGDSAIILHCRSYIIIKNIQIQNYTMGVYGDHSQNCVIENVIAKNTGNPYVLFTGAGIKLTGTSENDIIRNCIVDNNSNVGIAIAGYGNIVEDCKVYCNEGLLVGGETPSEREAKEIEAMDYYIVILTGANNIVTGCYIESDPNIIAAGHGFQIKRDSEYNLVKDCIAVNLGECFTVAWRGAKYNTFENCLAIGDTTRRNQAINIRDGASFNTFKNIRSINTEHAVFFYDSVENEDCVYVGAGNGSYIENANGSYSYVGAGYGDYERVPNDDGAGHDNRFENCIFKSTDSCINFNAFTLNTNVYYNKFINCTFDGGSCLFEAGRVNNGNSLTNCIIHNIPYESTGPYGVNYRISYSNFYNSFSPPSGIEYPGNFSSDPLFVDAANGDYRLKASSPCIDAGIAASVYVIGFASVPAPSIDFNYLSRPQGSGYDVGAHEYSANAPALAYFKLNENTGTSTADNMDNIANGNISGAVWSTGVSGSSLNFDGINDYVDFGNPGILELAGSRTISAWIKITQNDHYNVIASKGLWGYSLFTNYGKLRAHIAGSSGSAYSRNSEIIPVDGKWKHIAMTFDVNGDKKIHLFVNGVEVDYYEQVAMPVDSTPVSTSASNFCIGSSNGTDCWFNGEVDEVKVFERAFSAQELLDEYRTVFSADLNKGVGAVVVDASFGNNGTIYGADWIAGIYGKALDFDGVDDYVDCGNDSSLDITEDITVEAWIKPAATQVDHATVLCKGETYKIRLNDNRVYCGGTIGIGYGTSFSYSDDEWIHIAWTFSEATGDIITYKNGVQQTPVNCGGNIASTTDPLIIGTKSTGYRQFNGVIDEVRIYSKVLSENEIYQDYEKSLLCGGWSFEEGIGTTASDSSVNSNDGLLMHMNTNYCWVDGKVGEALEFDGYNDYVDCGNNKSLDITGDITVEAWVKPAATQVDHATVLSKGGKYKIRLNDHQVYCGSSMGIGYGTSFSYSDDEWIHIVWTFSETTGDIITYKNGVQQTPVNCGGSIESTTDSLLIGADSPGFRQFNGVIDEVKIYKRVLSAAEVLAQYHRYE